MMGFTSNISILLLFLSASTFHKSMSNNHSVIHCYEKDRRALSIFKQGVIDPCNRLLTWSSEEDCCAWKGVQCDNTSGRVTKIGLQPQRYGYGRYQYQPLRGKINLLSLLELEFLNHLDLSRNNFEAIIIPPIHANNTSAATSHLRYLDISFNSQDLYLDNLQWVSRLSSLKYLNLSTIDLHKETNWLQLVAMLPSLSELRLSTCKLTNISPSLEYVNFTNSLVALDLSRNNFSSELPYWLFNLSTDISHLDLRLSNFQSEIPSSLLSLRNLKFLDLSWNQLTGLIPYWIGQYEHLQYLYLSGNLFSGSIPSTFGNLSSLIDLRIDKGKNSLSGVLSETIFSKLSNLKVLKLGGSTFKFDFDPEWIPPFQLSVLCLANTSQGPKFPSWIYTQRSLEILDISSSGISFVDGDKFWSFVAGIKNLSLSYNSIRGDISKVTLNSRSLKLDHNNFTGGLPHMSANVSYVDLSHNSFSGPIPNGLENWKYLYYINLGSNKLSGEVPSDLSNMIRLEFMDLGENEFFGTIPMTLPQSLQVIILRSNRFSGRIPSQLWNLSFLFHMDLAHNMLSGSIPQSIYNITAMATDDASKTGYTAYSFNWFTKGHVYEYNYNGLSRTIDLSANNLSGEIPLELFELVEVQTLDLSTNQLTGGVPKTIGDMKNLESLDLSNNKLSGEIPQSMVALSFLDYLNLSHNNFSGKIPIGTQLQSFDASSYIGNPKLCGVPLTKKCPEENIGNGKLHGGHEDGDAELLQSLYLGMGVGFAVGLWGLCVSLFLNRTWRQAYFRLLNHVAHRLHVVAPLTLSNFGGTGASSN